MASIIYLDNNSSTPMLPGVITTLNEANELLFANPNSQHGLGQESARRVELARQTIATFINAQHSREIHFVSGATEAIASSIRLGAEGVEQIIVGRSEHSAVLDAATAAEAAGKKIVRVDVDERGALDLSVVREAGRRAKSLIVIGLVNSEVGTIANIDALSEICADTGSLLSVDASQAVGRVYISVERVPCDFLCLSPHKFHGPKGVGILYARGRPDADVRSGTPNVPAILGAAAALDGLSDWQAGLAKIADMRDRLEQAIVAGVARAAVNGQRGARVANTSNIYFPMRSAADLVAALSARGVCVSAGAACSTGGQPSHVLLSMGYGRERANSSLRFSLSRLTTSDEIKLAIQHTLDAYRATLPSLIEP